VFERDVEVMTQREKRGRENKRQKCVREREVIGEKREK